MNIYAKTVTGQYKRTGNMDFDWQSINFYDEYTIHVYKFLGIS